MLNVTQAELDAWNRRNLLAGSAQRLAPADIVTKFMPTRWVKRMPLIEETRDLHVIGPDGLCIECTKRESVLYR